MRTIEVRKGRVENSLPYPFQGEKEGVFATARFARQDNQLLVKCMVKEKEIRSFSDHYNGPVEKDSSLALCLAQKKSSEYLVLIFSVSNFIKGYYRDGDDVELIKAEELFHLQRTVTIEEVHTSYSLWSLSLSLPLVDFGITQENAIHIAFDAEIFIGPLRLFSEEGGTSFHQRDTWGTLSFV